jgi:hypothetical protein
MLREGFLQLLQAPYDIGSLLAEIQPDRPDAAVLEPANRCCVVGRDTDSASKLNVHRSQIAFWSDCAAQSRHVNCAAQSRYVNSTGLVRTYTCGMSSILRTSARFSRRADKLGEPDRAVPLSKSIRTC